MRREEQRNLQNKIVTSKLLILGCIIIYPQNFQYMLQEITISVQLKVRENIWGAAQKHSTPGKTRRRTVILNTIYIWLLSLPALGRMNFFHLFSVMLSKYISKCYLAICSCQTTV